MAGGTFQPVFDSLKSNWSGLLWGCFWPLFCTVPKIFFLKKSVSLIYSTLNGQIRIFQYYASDCFHKEMRSAFKHLNSHATQNWNFLRLPPLVIGERMDETFRRCALTTPQLKHIVDMMLYVLRKSLCPRLCLLIFLFMYIQYDVTLCSRKVTWNQSIIMDVITKHWQSIRLWHFEGKRSPFKSCLWNLKNKKKIKFCLTISERHVMLQTYLSLGSTSQDDLEIKDSSLFMV